MRILDDPRNPKAIKPEILEALRRYTKDGLPPGSFLEAVLSNDLMEAVQRADEENLRSIVAIATHVHNQVPWNIFGTKKLVKLWIELGAAIRLNAGHVEINRITEGLLEALKEKHEG